jgi:hypothetical protein
LLQRPVAENAKLHLAYRSSALGSLTSAAPITGLASIGVAASE